MCGAVELGDIFTSEFDVGVDWSSATAVKLGADGKFTVGGSGTAVNAVILKRPTAGDPVLGLALK
jgi:hypothetical protein